MMPNLISAFDLSKKTFPRRKFLVQDLIPEGVTLLAGRPKVGKSWMLLQLGLAIAEGATFLDRDTTQGDVLYYALEDSERRLYERLSTVRPHGLSARGLAFALEAPRIGSGLAEDVEEWASSVTRPTAVLIDTLGFVKPKSTSSRNEYSEGLEHIRPLKDLATELGIFVLFTHHLRKMGQSDAGGDPFERILGTQAIHGTVDTALVLERERFGGSATLYTSSRDVEDQQISLSVDPKVNIWTVAARPRHVAFGVSPQASEAFDLFLQGITTNTGISEALGIKPPQTSALLQQLGAAGLIHSPKHGKWELASSAPSSLEDEGEGVVLPTGAATPEVGEIHEVGDLPNEPEDVSDEFDDMDGLLDWHRF